MRKNLKRGIVAAASVVVLGIGMNGASDIAAAVNTPVNSVSNTGIDEVNGKVHIAIYQKGLGRIVSLSVGNTVVSQDDYTVEQRIDESVGEDEDIAFYNDIYINKEVFTAEEETIYPITVSIAPPSEYALGNIFSVTVNYQFTSDQTSQEECMDNIFAGNATEYEYRRVGVKGVTSENISYMNKVMTTYYKENKTYATVEEMQIAVSSWTEDKTVVLSRITNGQATIFDYYFLGIKSVTKVNITDINWYIRS